MDLTALRIDPSKRPGVRKSRGPLWVLGLGLLVGLAWGGRRTLVPLLSGALTRAGRSRAASVGGPSPGTPGTAGSVREAAGTSAGNGPVSGTPDPTRSAEFDLTVGAGGPGPVGVAGPVDPARTPGATGPTGLVPVLTASGHLECDRLAELRFRILGRIREIPVDVGDRVVTGQVLARLETGELDAHVDRARAGVAAHQAVLAELERGSREEDLDRARAGVEEARAGLTRATAELERVERLSLGRVTTPRELDLARADAEGARARLEAARQSLRLLEAGPRGETLEAARARVAEARAMLDLARVQQAEAELKAPFPGVILERRREVGEVVGLVPGLAQDVAETVVTLADLTRMLARVDVSESNLARVAEGMVARIVLDAYPDWKIAGRVVRVLPRADRKKAVVPVEVSVEAADPRLRPDLGLRVEFLAPEGS